MNRIEKTLRLPRDPKLPGLASLLDSRKFAGAVDTLLPPDSSVVGCRPLYVRYKPETNAIAVFEVEVAGLDRPLLLHGKCHSFWDYDKAKEKASSGSWKQPVLGRPFAARDEDLLLLFAFPNDQALDGLRLAANPKRLQRALYAHEPAVDQQEWRLSDSRMVISPVRFKPEKRAVLRVDTRAVHRAGQGKKPVRIYARVNSRGQGSFVADLMARLYLEFVDHPLFTTPRVIVHLDQEQTTLVADVGGQPLSVDASSISAAGRILANLHPLKEQGLEVRSTGAILANVDDTVTTIAHLAPELEHEARHLCEQIHRKAGDHMDDGASDFVHGDFHPQQILNLPNRMALLDFDRSYSGDPMADLGNITANLIYQKLASSRDSNGTISLRESMVQAYTDESGRNVSRQGLSFWTAVGLMQLAPTPFRNLNQDWPEILAATLAACRKELSWA